MSKSPRATLAYLATPFTKYREGPDAACRDATRIAADLLATGVIVYSPISYCHALAQARGLDMFDLTIWLPIEERMCAACDVLIVAHLDGWQESEGIGREVERFAQVCKPIFDLDPATLRMERRTLRTQSDHFTEAELAIIRAGFYAGRTAPDVARELKCARRTIQVYFAKLRGGPAKSGRKPKPAEPEKPKRKPSPRFYHSDFVPS